MAKSMFYSAAEAAQRLGKAEADIKVLVRDGKLREFRDGATVNYKVDDVEKLAGGAPAPPKPPASAPPPPRPSPKEESGSDEILLEPADDSSVELSAGGGSDILTLEEADSDETSAGGRTAAKSKEAKAKAKKEGSSVASVGVNVFDEDDLDEHVDPLAQTAITDLGGMGLEGAGGGSGIMDLTRESDDTSLGRELLEEIYTPEGSGDAAADDTAAGTAEADDDEVAVLEEAEEPVASDKKSPKKRGRVAVATAAMDSEAVADPASAAMTALLGVGVLVMLVGSLAAASLLRGVTPAFLQWTYANMVIAAPAAIAVAGIAGGLTFFLSGRSR